MKVPLPASHCIAREDCESRVFFQQSNLSVYRVTDRSASDQERFPLINDENGMPEFLGQFLGQKAKRCVMIGVRSSICHPTDPS